MSAVLVYCKWTLNQDDDDDDDDASLHTGEKSNSTSSKNLIVRSILSPIRLTVDSVNNEQRQNRPCRSRFCYQCVCGLMVTAHTWRLTSGFQKSLFIILLQCAQFLPSFSKFERRFPRFHINKKQSVIENGSHLCACAKIKFHY